MDTTKNANDENGGNDGFVPRNNVNLYDQIKLCIISDYFPNLLSKEREGTMEFFVRDGELAIHYHEIEVMLGTPIQQPHGCGMKRSHLITFLMMIEEQITSFTPIDYGSIIITYEMNNKGNFKAKMKFRQQVNHRRR